MSAAPERGLVARRPEVWAVALLGVAFGVTLVLMPWSDESVTDLGVRSSYAALLLDGALPYRDFFFEYPPLAAPAIAVPGIVGTDDDSYRLGIAAATLLVTAVVLLLAGRIARRTGGSGPAAMATIALSPLLLGALVRLHFDSLAVAFTLAAVVALLARRPALGLSLVGLGAMTKGFPIVVAPVALAWLWFSSGPRAAVRGGAALAATLLALGGAWLALSPDGAIDSIAYQVDRPVHLESSPASALLAVPKLGADDPVVVQGHGSSNIDHPLAGPTGVASSVVLLAAVGAFSLLAARAAQPAPHDDPGLVSARALALAALAAVAAFVAFGRVLSPQYMIWVVPLLALAVAWRMWVVAALCATACVLTLVEFPGLYLELGRFEAPAIAVTAARNAALIGAVIGAGVRLWRDLQATRDEGPVRALIPAG